MIGGGGFRRVFTSSHGGARMRELLVLTLIIASLEVLSLPPPMMPARSQAEKRFGVCVWGGGGVRVRCSYARTQKQGRKRRVSVNKVRLTGVGAGAGAGAGAKAGVGAARFNGSNPARDRQTER